MSIKIQICVLKPEHVTGYGEMCFLHLMARVLLCVFIHADLFHILTVKRPARYGKNAKIQEKKKSCPLPLFHLSGEMNRLGSLRGSQGQKKRGEQGGRKKGRQAKELFRRF